MNDGRHAARPRASWRSSGSRPPSILLAYALILERIYGIELGVEVPVIFTSADPATGLERHFQLEFDWRFVEVRRSARRRS